MIGACFKCGYAMRDEVIFCQLRHKVIKRNRARCSEKDAGDEVGCFFNTLSVYSAAFSV